jgi:hypothetical protein
MNRQQPVANRLVAMHALKANWRKHAVAVLHVESTSAAHKGGLDNAEPVKFPFLAVR